MRISICFAPVFCFSLLFASIAYSQEGSGPSLLDEAKADFKAKNWEAAIEKLESISEGESVARKADAKLLLGKVYEERGDVANAAKAYLVTFASYPAYHEQSVEAFYRYYLLSKNTVAGKKDKTRKKQGEKALYRLYIKQMYMWQKLDSKTGSGSLKKLRSLNPEVIEALNISPEDKKEIYFRLGIPDKWEIPMATEE